MQRGHAGASQNEFGSTSGDSARIPMVAIFALFLIQSHATGFEQKGVLV
jgi:hypothetical protein